MEASATMSPLHNLTLGDVLRESRRSHPHKAALVCGPDRFTYPEMDDRANRLANALLADGVGRGDRVLWLGQNCPPLLEALLAAATNGATLCPLNWRPPRLGATFLGAHAVATRRLWHAA